MTLPSNHKPFLKWVGGKTQLLNQISPLVPQNIDTYIEPFVGGGAVFFHLCQQIKIAHLNDINEDLINTYSVVQHDLPNLISHLKTHQLTEDYYYSIRNMDREPHFHTLTQVERASRFIFLNKTCFNGLHRVNAKGQFNTPYGAYSNPKILDEDRLLDCSSVLKLSCADLSCQTYKQFLETKLSNIPNPTTTFVYLDPPYIPLNKTSNFVGYTKNGFCQKDHQELFETADQLTKMGVKWMLSNSSSPLVYKLYKKYNIHTILAKRQIASQTKSRTPVKEVLITNY